MVRLVHEKFEDITNVTIGVTIPLTEWKKWNEDCEENFNGVRWLKMKYDYEFRKQFSPIANYIIGDLDSLQEEIAFLKAEIQELKKVPSEPVTGAVRATLGGGEFGR